MKNLLPLISKNAEPASYLIEYTFTNCILGSQPKSEDVMTNWLRAKVVKETGDAKLAEEIAQSHVDRMKGGEKPASVAEAMLEDKENRAWTGFFQDEEGPYIGVYTVKASFRELLSSLGITKARRGLKQTHQHLLSIRACDEEGQAYSDVAGERLHFRRNDEVVTEPDGFVEMTAHVTTAQGPRSIIKRHDAIYDASIRFVVSVPAELPTRAKALINDEVISRVLAYAGNNGLGCSRSQGYGVFRVTRFERL